jgi:hypothetical protein
MARKAKSRSKRAPTRASRSKKRAAPKKKAVARKAAPRKAAPRKAAAKKAVARKAAPAKARSVRDPDETFEADLDDLQPLREEPHETLLPGAGDDDLAEELGEEYVESATSGEQSAEAVRDAEMPEETGGPFVETSATTEFGYDTDASNPKGAKRAPFPTSGREQ